MTCSSGLADTTHFTLQNIPTLQGALLTNGLRHFDSFALYWNLQGETAETVTQLVDATSVLGSTSDVTIPGGVVLTGKTHRQVSTAIYDIN